MLRREGLYTSHLTAWRKQQERPVRSRAWSRASAGRVGPTSEQVELREVRARLDARGG